MRRLAARSMVMANSMLMARTATASHAATHLATNPG